MERDASYFHRGFSGASELSPAVPSELLLYPVESRGIVAISAQASITAKDEAVVE
jgi:hypothetical protein